MVSADYTTLTKNWLIKGIGLLINFMAKGKFSMINPYRLWGILIILILILWGNNGCHMKEHLFVILRKALANLCFPMGSIMKAILREIGFLGRALSMARTKLWKEFGKIQGSSKLCPSFSEEVGDQLTG